MKNFIKKYNVLIFLILAYVIIFFDKGLMSLAAIPLSEQFGFTNAQIGLFGSAYSLGYALVSFPGGFLADKFGYKKVLVTCLLTSTIAACVYPFASVLILFLAIRFILGAAHASNPSVASKAIAMKYKGNDRTTAQSWWFLGGNIGGFAASYIGARIIAINWQYAYWTVAVLYAITVVLIIVFFKEIKTKNEETKASKNNDKKVSLKEILKDRNVWVFAISIFGINLILNGNGMWYAKFLNTEYGLDMITIGNINAISTIISLGTAPLNAILLNKIFRGKENRYILISAIVTAILFVLLVSTNSLLITILCGYLISYAPMLAFMTIKTLPQKIIKDEYIGSTMGVITAVSSFGGFVAPTLLGVIIDLSGGKFIGAFYFLALIVLIAGVVSFLGLKMPKEVELSKSV